MGMTTPELRDLLADSLAVWGVAGRITVSGAGVVVAAAGHELRILPAERPLRWWLERPGQRRPYPGTVGLLRGVRNALGAGDGQPVRLRVSSAAGA